MSSELSGMALNRALAKAQGYHLTETEPLTYVLSKDGKAIRTFEGPVSKYVAWDRVFAPPHGLPDWAHDEGAALRLCLEIALKHNWQVEVCPYTDGSYVASFTQAFDDRYVQHVVSSAGPAQAMSLLALAALERNREVRPEILPDCAGDTVHEYPEDM